MKLFTQIKESQLQARLDGDKLKAGTLTCVIGDAQQVSKTPTDDEVIKVITKHVKSLKETIYDVGDNLQAAQKANEEIRILIAFLPVRLSDEVVMEVARSVTDQLVNIGRIMGAVKQRCAKEGALFDGTQVKLVVDKLRAEIESA